LIAAIRETAVASTVRTPTTRTSCVIRGTWSLLRLRQKMKTRQRRFLPIFSRLTKYFAWMPQNGARKE
ncbi:unnamed protein product, partial [Symbiodinium pilosum]